MSVNTANPELVRAHERHRSATDLARRGHFKEALDQINAAIENSGGARLIHIPEFQLFKASILLRPNPELYDPETALACLDQCNKFAVDQWGKTRLGHIHYLCAQTAVALNDPFRATLEFGFCAFFMQGKTGLPAHLAPSNLLYNAARQNLIAAHGMLQNDDSLSREELRQLYDPVRYQLGLAIQMDWRLIGRIPTDPAMMNEKQVVIPVLEDFWAKHGPPARNAVRQYLAWFDEDITQKIITRLSAVNEAIKPKQATLKPKKHLEPMQDFQLKDQYMQILRDLAQDGSRPLDFVAAAKKIQAVADEFHAKVPEKISLNLKNLREMIGDMKQGGGDFITTTDERIPVDKFTIIKRARSIEMNEDIDCGPRPVAPKINNSFFGKKRQRRLQEEYRKSREAYDRNRDALFRRAMLELYHREKKIEKEFKARTKVSQPLAEEAYEFLSSLKLPPKRIVQIARPNLAIDPKRI